MVNHKVLEGECIESIAAKYGYFWETVWNDPRNSGLREHRSDPDALYPGDLVVLPDTQCRFEQRATEQRHRFRRRGVPSKLKFVARHHGIPRANERYELNVDGVFLDGKTDEEGLVSLNISPKAKKAKLLIGEGESQQEYEIWLGHLDPVETLRGAQERLANLGFDCGVIDGTTGGITRSVLTDFQLKHGLEQTGELDEATQHEIESSHGR